MILSTCSSSIVILPSQSLLLIVKKLIIPSTIDCITSPTLSKTEKSDPAIATITIIGNSKDINMIFLAFLFPKSFIPSFIAPR